MSEPTDINGLSASGTSTLASGPAGSHFEGQVAASYLLAMLSGAPPRGLPGTYIDRVALQQANAGRSLDDVIVYAHDGGSGKSAVLEIQVKRSITFTAADPVFKKVVSQIARAAQHPDFPAIRYELAIATAKTSRKIDGAYQDVLALARRIGDAATFAAQLALAGAANNDMRAFVNTFRQHLQDEDAPYDDETVWSLLRRLQILTFDFTAPGSASHDLALERAARALHSDDLPRVGALWASLVELALDTAKGSGDQTRASALQALATQGFRFVGERRHASSRAALAEASRLALADFRNRVGNVVLARQERVAAIHEAVDKGRYVEVRGEAGVGKSGVLRHIAETLQAESQVVVLSPGRCVPRGWAAMKAQLGFDGTLRELLGELASDGGATIFVDNLDSFSELERLTAIDLVREASLIPGTVVVTSARPEFGIDEPSWLPSDAIDLLVRAEPVTIGDLTKTEIDQLTAIDPTLAPLLSASHPARAVTRNLFRLERLVSQPASTPVPHTEVDMAEQWWKSADGLRDQGWRDRSRLLRELALQTIAGSDHVDVSGQGSASIDALVSSGTLRNLDVDRVAFRHDVLRQWAIANALHADSRLVDRLSLDRPAAAIFSRGVELTARMAVEQASTGAAWLALLERLSQPGVHRSWRRAALLAVARSEAGEALLMRVAPELAANGATLLRELIRTVMAVDVIPASKAFAALGVDLALIPSSLNLPRGPAWTALVVWLLRLGDKVPVEAIPEVVQLFTMFSVGTFGITDVTPLTTRQIYGWLRLMEPSDAKPLPAEGSPFWTGLDRAEVRALQEDLRSGFALFARRTPELAAEYLTAVAQSEHDEVLVSTLLRSRGSLVQAAPREFADLTARALIAKPRRGGQRFGLEREDPFTYLDHEFLPASPSQGPFLELLTHSPEHGLALVRRVVAHAVAHGNRGAEPGENGFTVVFPDGPRTFPWTQTYFWSRDSGHYAATSGLMALEAWAHSRLEAGEAFKTVLADVLGPPGSCAAYVLVAVDLVISHWPKSVDVAASFLACPELLCVDHTRPLQERLETPGFFGLGASRYDPKIQAAAADLTRRPSRQASLDELVGRHTFAASAEQHAELQSLLTEAARRLGPAGPHSNLGDPEFMVQHALNLVDASNWQEVEVTLKDGSTVIAHKYVAPEVEREHLAILVEAATERSLDFSMQSALGLALSEPSRLTPDRRSAAVTWARGAGAGLEPGRLEDETDQRMTSEAILTAALVVMRDGDERLRADHSEWARSRFADALKTTDDDVGRQVRMGLRFNPTAIAFDGLIHALSHRYTAADLRIVLQVAASGNHAAAHGLGPSLGVLHAVDDRLPRALLRCALGACVIEHAAWDADQQAVEASEARALLRAEAAVAAEMVWLNSTGPEPGWPTLPEEPTRARRRLRLPSLPPATSVQEEESPPLPSPTSHFDFRAAAIWLDQTLSFRPDHQEAWLCAVVKAYLHWTLVANGSELDEGDEADHLPYEWNRCFFLLVARCAIGLSPDEVNGLVVHRILKLPERSFLDIVTELVRSLDRVYFEDGGLSTEVAIAVRSALADRILTTRGWARLVGSKDLSIERHIGSAVAVLFFGDQQIGQGARCYLLPKGVERTAPFLPLLNRVARDGPSPYLAIVILNLLEVAPRAEHLPLLVTAGRAWLNAYPDFVQLWVDQGIGRRWCLLLDAIRVVAQDTLIHDTPLRPSIDGLVAALVALGVPEAMRLEEELSKL